MSTHKFETYDFVAERVYQGQWLVDMERENPLPGYVTEVEPLPKGGAIFRVAFADGATCQFCTRQPWDYEGIKGLAQQ